MLNSWFVRPVRLALATSIGVILSLATAANHAAADEVVLGDDGWRRTAHGWERVESLQAQKLGLAQRRNERFIEVDPSLPPAVRWDFHPAGLALVQVVVVALAFALARSAAKNRSATVLHKGEQTSLVRNRSLDNAA